MKKTLFSLVTIAFVSLSGQAIASGGAQLSTPEGGWQHDAD